MASTAKKATAKPKDAGMSDPISGRIRKDHLQELDRIAALKGIKRWAAVQIAIAEFIARKGK